MKTINIVIVDDDEDDYLIVDGYLKEISGVHFNTVWIPDFNLAVQAIKEQKADVYLVDYMMGEKTGLDVLAAVNTPLLQKPIILVTGHQDRNIDLQAMDMGAADFLYKRTLTSELLERSIRYSIKQSEDRMRLHEADQFEMQKKALETANEFKSRYVADICHEIRNPLGAIIGFADLAGDPGTNEEERVHFISTIQRNGEYLLGLLSDVLDLAKLEAGQVQIFVEKFKPMNVFSDVIDLMRVSARAKGLELDLIVENPSLEI
ncbi:MAG: hybrid sensor histidine kinase/response regulator, partial [Bdellovibrionota bacterium]